MEMWCARLVAFSQSLFRVGQRQIRALTCGKDGSSARVRMLYTADRGESLGMQKTHACDEDRSVGFDNWLLVAAAGTYRRLPIGVD